MHSSKYIQYCVILYIHNIYIIQMIQNSEPKIYSGKCLAILNSTSFLILSDKKQEVVITLPFIETEKINPWEGSQKNYEYETQIYLIKNILNRDISYQIIEKKKGILYGSVYIGERILLHEMIRLGHARLLEGVKNQNYIKMEKESQKLELNQWNSKNHEEKKYLQLLEQSIKNIYSNLQKKKYLKCFVNKIDGLKILLSEVQENYLIISYLSELKIPRINYLDPKKAWAETQNYINKLIANRIIQLEIIKYEVYKGEVSLFGIIRIDGINIRNKIVENGYAELSKNAKDFLNKEEYQITLNLQKKAKYENKGLFHQSKPTEQQKFNSNSSNKLKQYMNWIEDPNKKVTNMKNPNEQLTQILSQLKLEKKQELTDQKMKKLKILSQVFCHLLINNSIRYISLIKEFNKITCNLIIILNSHLASKLQSLEYMKLINILLRNLIFFLSEFKDNQEIKKQENIINDLEKLIKFVFKLVFIGNSVFHQKIFGKLKDLQFQNFYFSVVNYSGISSSYSEISDTDQSVKMFSKEQSKKKLFDTYTKIRISSSLLLNLIFKVFPILWENNWQICVKSYIFSQEFNEHIRHLQYRYEGKILTQKQKDRIINFMRINFGDHSLLSMVIFEQNTKVKINILNCLINMINNFQGKKTLVTLDLKLFEVQTKSSFIPKSFVIYSAFKNIFYTLLFCLYYEKNIQIILLILRTISEMIQHTVILEKISFNQGAQILIKNYIFSILNFPETQPQLIQLKEMSIECLSKIISSNFRWKDFQLKYLYKEGDQKNPNNIPQKLMQIIIKNKKLNNWQNEKIINQINTCFSKIIRNYFKAVVVKENKNTESIWNAYKKFFINIKCKSFTKVIEEICKKTCKIISEDDQDQKQFEEITLSQEQQQFCQNFIKYQLPEFFRTNQKVEDVEQLINILNIFTFLNKNIWQNEYFTRCYNFLIYCFQKCSPIPFQKSLCQQQQFDENSKIHQFKNNILVKVAYVKLIGYMSFTEICKKTEIIKNVFKILLINLKSIKGLNTLIKSSWALSNWCNVQNFHVSLTNDQLNILFQYLMDFSKSDKQKVASNGTRGIGMFIRNLPKDKFSIIKNAKQVQTIIINNLHHKSVKVSWNCSVTMRNIIKSQNSHICQQLFKQKQFFFTLLNNFSRSNYKLQIQTLQTFKYLDKEYILPYIKQILTKVTQIIGQTNGNLNNCQYSFAEFKYINILRKQLIKYYMQILLMIDDCNLQVLVKSNNMYFFLQNLYHYLIKKKQKRQSEKNKQILEKGSEASSEIQKEIFNIKKNITFHEQLQIKLNESEYTKHKFQINREDYDFFDKLKKLSKKLLESTQKNKDIKFSFSVFDAFQQLSQMQLSENSVLINLLEF